jgi:hypothetical protein
MKPAVLECTKVKLNLPAEQWGLLIRDVHGSEQKKIRRGIKIWRMMLDINLADIKISARNKI